MIHRDRRACRYYATVWQPNTKAVARKKVDWMTGNWTNLYRDAFHGAARKASGTALVFVTLLCAGCEKSNTDAKSITELRDFCLTAAEEARSNADRADAAAERAEKAAAQAKATLEAADAPSEEDQQACAEAAAAAGEARMWAQIADEQRRLDEILSSWTLAAYRKARGVALSSALSGLAIAADQADDTDIAALPQVVRDGAEFGADLARDLTGREKLPDGSTDWKGVSSDLRNMADRPPTRLGLLLALVHYLGGQTQLALAETELLDPAALESPEDQAAYHVIHALALSRNGLARLATREIEQTRAADTTQAAAEDLREDLAALHLVLAYVHLENRQYRQADLELVRAMQACPNNSVCTFLTGERLAATGEYEKATESLEETARTPAAKWLSKRLAERARRLRDQQAEAEPLLSDPAFVRDFVLAYIWMRAEDSPKAARLQRAIIVSYSFMQRFLPHVPGMDAAAWQLPQPTEEKANAMDTP